MSAPTAPSSSSRPPPPPLASPAGASGSGRTPPASASLPLSANAARAAASAAGGAGSHRPASLSSKELSEFDFTGIDQDLARFQQDELVKQVGTCVWEENGKREGGGGGGGGVEGWVVWMCSLLSPISRCLPRD